jgi:RHS repeat-associated protein
MNNRTAQSLLVLFALIYLAVPVAMAQSGANQINPGNATGTQPYNLYGGVRENINLSNGNLNLQIPLLTLPGRKGHDLSLALVYDSKIYQLHYETDEFYGGYWYWDWEERLASVGHVGWRVNLPSLWSGATVVIQSPTQPKYCTTFIVTLGDGSKYSFSTRIDCFHFNTEGDIVWDPQLDIEVGASQDASFMTLDAANAADIVLRMTDGSRVHFANPISYGLTAPSKIVDANGNKITFTSITQGFNITDTLGRVVTVNYACPGGITYKDSNGQTRSITWTCTAQSANPPITVPVSASSWTPTLLTSITLPNGRGYTFQYNSTPELTKITYPTGGYTRYDHGGYQHWWEMWGSGGSSVASFRQVNARYVCPSSSGTCATEETTTYTPTVNDTKTNNQYADARDPLGNRTRHQFSFRQSSQPGSKYFSSRETWRWVYQGESTLLRTVQTEYNALDTYGNPTNSSLPIRVTTTLHDSNQVTKQEWDYGSYGNVTEFREYDYGIGAAGGLARKTVSTWVAVNPVNSQDYTANSIHIRSLKASETVYDSGGAIKAQSQWEYDSYSEAVEASGTVQHESSFGTGYTTRGNTTAIKRWRNTDSAWLETRNLKFDDAGNLLKTRDPGQHVTLFSYSDSWTNTACQPTGGSAKAYLTSVTNPLGHVTTSTYNSCSGSAATTTDPNSQTTTFSYDLMNRLIQTNLPGSGQTTRTFNEGSAPLSVTTTTKITASLNLISTVTVDGLGREALSSLDSDPQGVTRTKTEYDTLGRKKRAYNPTRCPTVETNCGESTWGYTDFEYDALGRPTKVIPPDGTAASNHVTTSYSGNTVTVTDQAGKKRKSETDALGRLIRVWEPDATQSLVHVTRYQYDALNNLLCVHQKSTDATPDKACGDATVPAAWRERRFTYNSLSQLLAAYNPESGTISYAYDADGNLTSKTDARSIVATHTYDELHRLKKKTFSDTTPVVRYSYDGVAYEGCASALSTANGVGRRTAMCDAAGSESWAYDVLGRVLTDRRTTNSVTKDFTYQYNLDGSVWKITYPTGRTIEYQPTAAGRTEWAKDVANGINYATSASYAPQGALAGLVQGQAGGFAGYTLTQNYNNRLQPSTILATSPSSTLLDLSYDFVDANGKNSGNVDAILNNRNHNRDQSFTYDELNRVQTAQSAAASGGDCWGLQFGFDVYANLLSASVTKCAETALSLSVNTQNRITNTGFAYDAAGNTTNDGSFSYTWDAESRMKSGAGMNYTYDGEGRRVQKSSGKLYWYGTGAEPLAESDLSGNVSEEYIFFGGKRVARRVVSSGTVFYSLGDHLSTSRVIVQASQTTACYEADYLPYGKERVITDTCPQNYKFTGKERDAESGLDYFGARSYASAFGRFQTPDEPFIDQHLGEPQSWNLYAYVRNNPLIYVDPTGQGLMTAHGGQGHMLAFARPGGLDSVFGESWSNYTEQSVGGESSETTATSAGVQQATQQQSTSNATEEVRVGQRRLRSALANILCLFLCKHSYIAIPAPVTAENPKGYDAWEVLGADAKKNPNDTRPGQQMRLNDPRHIRGKEKTVMVTAEQKAALISQLKHYLVNACPSCGSNYSLITYNSNTAAFNMFSQNPAGRISPPRAPLFTPGYWGRRGGWYDYYRAVHHSP